MILRFAFVGSAASGLVLAAGAVAHADLPDPTGVVSTTLDATTSSTDVSVVTTDVVSTANTVADTTRDAAQPVTGTVGEATDPITETASAVADTATGMVVATAEDVANAVDDVTNTVTRTTEDAVDAVGATVDGVPTDPVRAVLDEDVVGIGADAPGTGIAVRAGSVTIRTDAVQEGRRHAAVPLGSDLATGTSLLPSIGTIPADPSAPSTHRATSPPSPLAPPVRDSSPPWPVEPLAAGVVLALIGVLALRSPSAPPAGWFHRLLRTTAFHGAAVALAVERPG